jgi:hypothetical protein
MARRASPSVQPPNLSRQRTEQLLDDLRGAGVDARRLKVRIQKAQRETLERHAKKVRPERSRSRG